MYIIFDIGGTNTRIATSKDGLSLGEPIKFATGKGADGPHKLIEMITQVSQGGLIKKIAGGITGTLNRDKTRLERSNNLSEWVNYPLAATLSQHFSCPVSLENDTAVVALGEAHHGAGKKTGIMAYFTVSTGVGGARIINGEIDQAHYGFEPGHHIMDWQTKETFETLTSGKSNEKKYNTEITQIPPTAWPILAKQVAIGLYNASLFWSPEIIVLGGSMIVTEISIPIETIKKEYLSLPRIFPKMPDIVKAELGSFGGLFGALKLIK